MDDSQEATMYGTPSRTSRTLLSIVFFAAAACSEGPTEPPDSSTPPNDSTTPVPASIVLDRSDVSISGRAGEAQDTVLVAILNGGDATLGGLDASIAYASDGDWLSAWLDRDAAPATLLLLAHTESMAPGTYEAGITVSAEGVDTSRTVTLSVQLEATPMPDLAVEIDWSTAPDTVEAGGIYAVPPGRVTNRGDSASLNFSALMAFSLDTVLDPADDVVSFAPAFNELEPGESASWSDIVLYAPRGLEPGSYHVIVWADYDRRNDDPDRSNNWSSSPVAVVAPDDSEPGFTVQTNASPGGLVSVSPSQVSYEAGTRVELVATPMRGYTFVRWQGDATGSVNPLTVTVDRDLRIDAVFERIIATPRITSSHANGSRVALTWDFEWPCLRCSATADDRYELEEFELGGGRFANVATIEGTRDSPYSYSLSRSPGTYRYRVRAAGTDWQSPWSDIVEVTVADEGPEAPTGLQAVVSGVDIVLTWTDNSDDEDGFRIDWDGSDSFAGGQYLEAPANTERWELYDDQAPGTWYLRVRAVRDGVVSEPSNVVRVTTTVPTLGLARFVNESVHTVFSLEIDGLSRLGPDEALLDNWYYEIELPPGTHTFRMRNGVWDGTGWNQLHGREGTFTLTGGDSFEFAFQHPTARQLMTKYSTAHTWSGWTVDVSRYVELRFDGGGNWSESVNEVQTRSGVYTLQTETGDAGLVEILMIPNGQPQNAFVGTLWEFFDTFSYALQDGAIIEIDP